MPQPSEAQREQLVRFLERHAVLVDTYATWVLLLLAVLVVILAYRALTRARSWPVRVAVALPALLLLAADVSVGLLIHYPLKPFIESIATVSRSIDSIPPGLEFVDSRTNETHTLAEFKGRVVALNFWGTFCRPCVEEMPDLRRLESELERDLVVVALSDESREAIEAFLVRHAAPRVVGRYSTERWIELGTFRPLTVYIDRSGKVREYYFGRSTYALLRRTVGKYL